MLASARELLRVGGRQQVELLDDLEDVLATEGALPLSTTSAPLRSLSR